MKELLKNLWQQMMVLTLVLSTTWVMAQTAGNEIEVKGTVVSASENALLAGSTVLVKDAGGRILSSTNTRKDGTFNVKVKSSTAITVVINYIGFNTYDSGAIMLSQEDLDLGRIYLDTKSTMLEGVTVVASRNKPLVQSTKDKLIYNAASDISNKSGNAADVLRKAPMLTVGANGDLKLRGNSNIKILINGIPSRIMAKNLKEALKMIPASSIVSVEVITNPSSKYEAEGAAGVVNIITKKKLKGTSGTLDITGGNLEQTGNLSLNMSTGKFNFSAMGNYSREREKMTSSLNRTNLNNGKQIGSLFQESDMLQTTKGGTASLSAQYKIDSLQTLEASYSYWNGSWPQKGGLFNRYKNADQYQEYRQKTEQSGKFNFSEWVLNYQKKFHREGQELQLIGLASTASDVSNYLSEQYKPDGQLAFTERGPNKGKEKEWSLQADYSHPLGKEGKTALETGAKYLGNNSKSVYEVLNSAQPVDPSRSGSMQYRQQIFSAYATLNFDLGNDWTLRPGIRFENTNINATFQNNAPYKRKFANWVPNLLVVKKLGERHEVKLDYNERIRRPWIMDLNPYANAADPLNITQGNPYLKPELTKKLELSHTYTGSGNTLLTSSIYYSSNKNAVEQIARVNEKGISYTMPDNIGESTRMGVNVNTVFNPVKIWTVNAGAEVFHLKFRSNSLGLKNDGTFFNSSISNTINVMKGLQFSASGDYGNGFITLQGKTTANYSYRFAMKKDFRNNKASLTLAVINPFQNNFKETFYAFAPTFQSMQINRFYNRAATLTFSWQFGGLRASKEKESHFSDPSDDKSPRRRRK
ncbi:TonB-dependent receptor domain-containing protein [Sphingobacterium multivorum]|uniref:TonB-dependent receptor domain-containing protein n=1 Tax=Sphingobacterium multivorum TaxID=28454 RepID=UPI0028A62759|nr:TonB-dependent receptor [Sphingobacterium multivorum]